MKSSTEALTLRGDLLSCYTASIAAYMERNGIDSELALGTQLFLAVRAEHADAPTFSFVHYHTPLLGDTPTHTLELARQEAAEPGIAARRIVAEWQRAGAVIVVGDAMNLPWLVTHGHRHAPHWFLLSAVDEQAGSIQVIDQFEFVDPAGTQLPFAGSVDLQLLATLARVNPVPLHVFQARDRWAFGRELSLSSGEFQWFEQQSTPQAKTVSESLLRDCLRSTVLYNSGLRERDDLLSGEWSCGIAAIQCLAEWAERYLDNPALYDISDDLWVAARNRQMFAHVLRRLAAELNVEALAELAEWAEGDLATQWLALPRIMHYNVGLLKRGRRPTALLEQTLRTVAELESQLMERLGKAVGV